MPSMVTPAAAALATTLAEWASGLRTCPVIDLSAETAAGDDPFKAAKEEEDEELAPTALLVTKERKKRKGGKKKRESF